MKRVNRLAVTFAASGVFAIVAAGQAQAQRVKFDLPEGRATETLPFFALQSGLEIVASSASLAAARTPRLRGTYDVRRALQFMIRRTSLVIVSDRNNVITLRDNRLDPKPANAPATSDAVAAGQTGGRHVSPSTPPARITRTREAPSAEIIVTGTRAANLLAVDSAAPIRLLFPDMLDKTGQPSLNRSLAQFIPSFSRQSKGADMANFSLSARLRGLNPNHTLVMVNGKRRHNPALLQTATSPYQGSVAPSIDLIPPDAVKRIEVLQEGAAAQYGSDAIAGVINILLKDDDSGGTARTSYGQYFDGEGATWSASTNLGFALADAGFINLTLFHRKNEQTYQGEGQSAVTDVRTGVAYASLTGEAANWAGLNLANINRGIPKSSLTVGMLNASLNLGSVELYGFGDASYRAGYANQNYRHPARICTDSTIGANGGSGTYDPTSCLAGTGTAGIVPVEKVTESEWSMTAGLRGETHGFNWDASTTYGYVKNDIWTLQSANRQLFLDTGASPRDFYDGAFTFSQWISTLDITRDLDLGMARPLTLAVGGEYRQERSSIQAGDVSSYYGDGAQGFAGYKPSDAGRYRRSSAAVYLNGIVTPLRAWTIDLAGRYETYSSFGGTVIGKIATRYALSDSLALRGTISTGFRAPTLQESYYSAVILNPNGVIAQLPPNSAAARALGFEPLKPEKSNNYSAGMVVRIAPAFLLTLDGYYIEVKDRIVNLNQVRGLVGGVRQTNLINGIPAYEAVLNAINAQHIGINDTMTALSAQTFTNGIATRTWGFDLSVSRPVSLRFGTLDLSLAANYGKTRVIENKVPNNLFDEISQSYIEDAEPRFNVIFSAAFSSDRFTLSLQQSYRASSSVLVMPAISGFGPYRATIDATPLTDLELGYKINRTLTLSLGANNLFNKKPEKVALLPDDVLSTLPNGTSPYIDGTFTIGDRYSFGSYDLNGGFYYARLSLSF